MRIIYKNSFAVILIMATAFLLLNGCTQKIARTENEENDKYDGH